MFDGALFKLKGFKRAIVFSVLQSLLGALFVVGQSIFLASAIVWVWRDGAQVFDAHAGALAGLCAAFAICLILRQCVANWQESTANKFASETFVDFNRAAAADILELGPAYVKHEGTSGIVSKLAEGLSDAADYIQASIIKWPQAIVLPLVILVSLAWLDWVSALIALICWPFSIVFMRLIGASAGAQAKARYAQFSSMSNSFVDITRGLGVLKTFGIEGKFSGVVFKLSEKFRKLTMKTLKVAMLSSAVLDIFSTLCLAGVAIMLGFRLVEGTVEFLNALCVLMLVPEFFKPLRALGENYHATLDGKTAFHDFLAIQKNATSARQNNGGEGVSGCAAATCVGAVPDKHSPLSPAKSAQGLLETLRFEGVSFKYAQGGAGLEDVAFSAHAPCMVGVFGKSGAGKTTLLNVIAGFTRHTGGKIYVNGECLPTLACASWRSRVVYIPQTPTIFTASIRENVAFYNTDATDSEIMDALQRVGLLELVERMPDGLGTIIGEGAHGLSGGQLQRIALCRALCDAQRDVWILDEATAHLDSDEEERLIDLIVELTADKLVFVASHNVAWASRVMESITIGSDLQPSHVTVSEGLVLR